MSWKTAYRSMYYQGAPEPADIDLDRAETALLVIDVQNTYLETRDRAAVPPGERAKWDLWAPFNRRLRDIVIPNTQAMIATFRKHHMEVVFARTTPHLSAAPELPANPAPNLGQHTREILQDLLGYDPKDVDRLAAEGVVQTDGA